MDETENRLLKDFRTKDKEICPYCRFSKRISGHVFMRNDEDFRLIAKIRCPICHHLPDYIITDTHNKVAHIIYRNFNGSEEYFKEVKTFLTKHGFKIE